MVCFPLQHTPILLCPLEVNASSKAKHSMGTKLPNRINSDIYQFCRFSKALTPHIRLMSFTIETHIYFFLESLKMTHSQF